MGPELLALSQSFFMSERHYTERRYTERQRQCSVGAAITLARFFCTPDKGLFTLGISIIAAMLRTPFYFFFQPEQYRYHHQSVDAALKLTLSVNGRMMEKHN